MTLEDTDSGENQKRRLSDVVSFYNTDYENVPIPKDSVIYCDPPYVNTAKYQAHKKSDFDYDRFYDWAERQEVPIFISEYWMPEDRFKCIAEIPRTSSYSQYNNAQKIVEKIYVPVRSKYSKMGQLSLFS